MCNVYKIRYACFQCFFTPPRTHSTLTTWLLPCYRTDWYNFLTSRLTWVQESSKFYTTILQLLLLLIFQLNLRVSNAIEFGLCAYVEEAAEEESSPQVKVDHIYLSESNVWGHKSSSKGRCVFMCLLYHYYYYIYNTFP